MWIRKFREKSTCKLQLIMLDMMQQGNPIFSSKRLEWIRKALSNTYIPNLTIIFQWLFTSVCRYMVFLYQKKNGNHLQVKNSWVVIWIKVGHMALLVRFKKSVPWDTDHHPIMVMNVVCWMFFLFFILSAHFITLYWMANNDPWAVSWKQSNP